MQNSIAQLIEQSAHIPPVFGIVGLFQIDETFNCRIVENTGFDLQGFAVSIDNYSINHSLKHHGNEHEENLRGQTAVHAQDFLRIENIVKEADKILNAGVSNIGKNLILFEK